MTYVATEPEKYDKQVVGKGQCVEYVRQATGAPASSTWKQGIQVKGADIKTGTAIATFQNGAYQNKEDGSSHAAIYLSQDAQQLWVYDQWVGQPVHKRPIRFKNGKGPAADDGDRFSVVA